MNFSRIFVRSQIHIFNYKTHFCSALKEKYTDLSVSFFSSEINECIMYGNICSGHGQCINTVGAYQCICNTGWTGQNCSIGELEFIQGNIYVFNTL